MQPPVGQGFSLVADIPWGEPDGIGPSFEGASSRGLVGPAQARRVFARPRVRLDAQGEIYILGSSGGHSQGDTGLYRLRDGQLTHKIGLPPPRAGEVDWRIVDFVPGFGTVFVLETFARENTRHNRVTALDPSGSVLWQITGLHAPNRPPDGASLAGSFQKLIPGQETTLLLVPATGAGRFGRIDAKTGNFTAPLDLEPLEQLQTFANCRGDLVRTVFLADRQRYGTARYHPATRTEDVVIGSDEVYGALQFAYGVDDDLNLYTHFRNTQNKISPTGSIAFTDHLVDLVYEPETASLLTLRLEEQLEEQRLRLSQVRLDGTHQDWDFEPPHLSEPYSQYRLIPSSEPTQFHVHTGERGMDPGSVMVFSTEGHRISEYPFNPQTAAPLGALGPSRDWQVSCDGAVLLPLTDERGLQIVRWNMPNEIT